MVNKTYNTNYSKVINICKLLKPHATTILLLENGIVGMDAVLPGIRNYFIHNEPEVYTNFLHSYINLPGIWPSNQKFRKTYTDLDWIMNDGQMYLRVTNPESAPYDVPMLNKPNQIDMALDDLYNTLPEWETLRQGNLMNDPDNLYTESDKDLAYDLFMKRMCKICLNGYSFLISKPFLGDTKNTMWIGYRIVGEEPGPDGRVFVKFKQKEKLGNIFTYAAFLKIPE